MPSIRVDPDKTFVFADAVSFERWLSANHNTADEVWIKIHKLASGLMSVTPKEAIDIALCWGWIDAIRKSFDDSSYLQRFTPRGRKSIWSKVNVDNVARLIAEGRMTEYGLAHVEAAKADGRWDRAYGGSRDMELPVAFLAAVEANPAAAAMLSKLTAQNRFALAFRLHNLKTDTARLRSIEKFTAMLARGETIHSQKKK